MSTHVQCRLYINPWRAVQAQRDRARRAARGATVGAHDADAADGVPAGKVPCVFNGMTPHPCLLCFPSCS